MRTKGVPKYQLFRIYLISILIYFMLILPVLLVLSLKMAPRFLETRESVMKRLGRESDTAIVNNEKSVHDNAGINNNSKSGRHQIGLIEIDERTETFRSDTIPTENSSGKIRIEQTDSDATPFSTAFTILFRVVIVFTIIVGLIINAPLKRYFSRKRKRKPVSEKIRQKCKRLILYTPYINSGILLFSFSVLHGYMYYVLMTGGGFEDALSRDLFMKFFYVSLIASLLIVLFVYFWQKHRVHIVYLEHVFEVDELYTRGIFFRKGKISNRLLISSGMTTLLPLAIVMLYILLALSPVSNIVKLTPEQMKIIIGPYYTLTEQSEVFTGENLTNLFYVNAIDNILMFTGIAMGVIVALIYIIFFIRWTTAGILSPVKELLYNMKWTGEGHVDNYTVVRTNDEIGELSEGYNHMTNRLMEYIDRISKMNETYVRFVPRQFLHFLGKDNFTEIKLGDQIQKEMTILFCDIRSFTVLSEEMSPKENFDFINHYLGLMEPAIRKNNGFIDKYIGDAIMALFGECVDDAIEAAVEMRKQLQRFNEERRALKKKEVNIGIGIHTGNLMLGIIGSERRMEGTVISDAVNLASRLEGLTKTYGASVIISEDALIKLKNPVQTQVRFLDIARVKGKRDSIYIFELLNGEEEGIKRLKWETRNDFGKAVALYRDQRFPEAEEIFSVVVRNNPADLVSRLYIERCQDYQSKGIHKDWSGIEMHEN